jgi:hypothetical protein
MTSSNLASVLRLQQHTEDQGRGKRPENCQTTLDVHYSLSRPHKQKLKMLKLIKFQEKVLE